MAVAPRRGESLDAAGGGEQTSAGADGRGGEQRSLRLAAAGEDGERAEGRGERGGEEGGRRHGREQRERGERESKAS